MTHNRSEWPHDKCIEVGADVCLSETVHGDDLHIAGFLFCHEVPGEAERCIGGVNVDADFAETRPVWTMSGSLAGGDLTISPSIRCVTHDPGPNAHGFVRGGKWVAA